MFSKVKVLIFLLFFSVVSKDCKAYSHYSMTMDMDRAIQLNTKWDIEPSFKYDALCFLNILTADTFYLTYYNQEYEKFKPKLTPEVTKSLSELKRKLKDENAIIISAWLCLYFSAVEDSTLEQMISTVDNPGKLKQNFEKSPYYDNNAWKLFESVKGELKTIFLFLKEINFHAYWKENILPIVEKKIAETEPDLPKFDVIGEDERMLGFKLPSDKITIYMLYYSQPHGIKITGTRFLTDAAWPFKIVLKNAVHEMMHPPYDYKNDTELRAAIESLGKDDFLMDKVLNHNPSFGYNTLDGLIEEDCVQTLEQLINEKFGIETDARKRWKAQDDGIHVFAIALYQVTKEENYNEKNEVFRDFLLRMINSGKLAAGKIQKYNEDFFK
jgi:hypothetical protein